MFAKGFFNQKLSSWLSAHQDAFAYYGGVTQILVPDNTSTASVRVHADEAARKVQDTYFAFADYHDWLNILFRATCWCEPGPVMVPVSASDGVDESH